LVKRRAFLASALAALAPRTMAADYPLVQLGHALEFPRDHGAHPQFRTEWWYVTGSLRNGAGRELGFQVTFFRSRPGVAESNRSSFAPRQLVLAHAAIADPRQGRLTHDQRAARTGFELAEAREANTDVWLEDWSMALRDGAYRTQIVASEFRLDLAFMPTQSILLQGDAGYSRKGPQPQQASYYYSRPHLSVAGSIERTGQRETVQGLAWLDHEWSSEYLAPEADGWDWVGINLDDGSAFMAFRIRAKAGGDFWAGGTLRAADGSTRKFGPREIRFEPLRRWRSPRTDVEYPVAMRVRAAEYELVLDPLMDDQELDSRPSTGTIYWEGAVRAVRGDRQVGRGYLELTGYWKRVRL
jgi:predicted secreted hydrolase